MLKGTDGRRVGGAGRSEVGLRNNFNANWPNPNAFYGHKINSMAQQDALFMLAVGRWAWPLHFSPSAG